MPTLSSTRHYLRASRCSSSSTPTNWALCFSSVVPCACLSSRCIWAAGLASSSLFAIIWRSRSACNSSTLCAHPAALHVPAACSANHTHLLSAWARSRVSRVSAGGSMASMYELMCIAYVAFVQVCSDNALEVLICSCQCSTQHRSAPLVAASGPSTSATLATACVAIFLLYACPMCSSACLQRPQESHRVENSHAVCDALGPGQIHGMLPA